jgi:hypothetical protein
VIDLAELGKFLIAWHSQRPNVAYSEAKIFDKYFEQLFRREYRPENVYALNHWMQAVMRTWTKDNPLGLNESLLVMRAYAPYHHLYGVSMCFAISNNQPDRVPSPEHCLAKAERAGLIEDIVKIAGASLNMALEQPRTSRNQRIGYSARKTGSRLRSVWRGLTLRLEIISICCH